MKIIITSQPEAAVIALNEIQRLDPGARGTRLSHEMQLVSLNIEPSTIKPIFIRHMYEVQKIIPLNSDIQELVDLCGLLPKHLPYTIHIRNTGDEVLPQSAVCEIDFKLSGCGYTKDEANPQTALSLVIHEGNIYAGASLCESNLSNWNGGMHRFKRGEEFISRSEFKLREAIAVFGADIRDARAALDLGAAPGGWSSVLLDCGLRVTAVDPADLSDSIKSNPRLTHIKQVVQKLDLNGLGPFDIIVNDMRMDMTESCMITEGLSEALAPGGLIIMTLKLPKAHWYKKTKSALSYLGHKYTIKGARQLFHNRSEVTVLGAKR